MGPWGHEESDRTKQLSTAQPNTEGNQFWYIMYILCICLKPAYFKWVWRSLDLISSSLNIFLMAKVLTSLGALQVAWVVKNLPANTGDVKDAGLILGSGRCSGGGHGNPLQYSCLENPMDRGAWQAMGHRVVKSQTQLKRLGTNVTNVYNLAHWQVASQYIRL